MAVTDNQSEVKALLGVPEDEPIFILRGKDKAAAPAVAEYAYLARDVGATQEFVQAAQDRGTEFYVWAERNPDAMKAPDAPSPGEDAN